MMILRIEKAKVCGPFSPLEPIDDAASSSSAKQSGQPEKSRRKPKGSDRQAM